MDNIEQLKLDNEKLKERLNNAAKFFKEQKAQIEALTKENEDLKEQIKDKDVEITNQKDALQSCYNQLHDYEIMLDSLNKEKENIVKQFKEQEKFVSEVINTKVPELETKLKDSEAAYNELQKKQKEFDIAKGEAELKAENLQSEYTKKFEEQDKEIKKLTSLGIDYVNQINALTKQIEEANSTIESKDKAYKVLQDTYNELFNDCVLLKETNKDLEDKCNGSKDAYSELRKTYEEYLVKDKEKDNKIQVQETQIKEFTEQIKEQDKKIKDLETINDTINKQLDDEENHRLAIENDYNDLVERVNVIDENICKFNKKDINEFCDNMLDFFKNHQL